MMSVVLARTTAIAGRAISVSGRKFRHLKKLDFPFRHILREWSMRNLNYFDWEASSGALDQAAEIIGLV
jgi:hypothetical protein